MLRADKLEQNEVITISDDFPIVVVTGDKAQIVYGKNIEKFKRENSGYSFLVPVEKYELFREQIKSDTKARQNPNSDTWDANFTAETITFDRQKFVVFATGNDEWENTGEYEATAKELFPKYHKHYFGPGKIITTFPTAMLLTAGLWTVLGTAIRFWRRKKYTN